MRDEFAKCEIKTSVFSGRKPPAGNYCQPERDLLGDRLAPVSGLLPHDRRGERPDCRGAGRQAARKRDDRPGSTHPQALSFGRKSGSFTCLICKQPTVPFVQCVGQETPARTSFYKTNFSSLLNGRLVEKSRDSGNYQCPKNHW